MKKHHRFTIPAALIAVLGLSGSGWVYNYKSVESYRDEVRYLQEFCGDLALAPTFATVKKVMDGDTFRTEGNIEVRLILPDAPEICKFFASGKPREEGCVDEPGGWDATNYLKDLIEGKEVVLVGDPVYGDQDHFGRKLRYVYVENTMVGLDLIEQGFAPVYSSLRTTAKFYDQAFAAEIHAREKGLGIWGN